MNSFPRCEFFCCQTSCQKQSIWDRFDFWCLARFRRILEQKRKQTNRKMKTWNERTKEEQALDLSARARRAVSREPCARNQARKYQIQVNELHLVSWAKKEGKKLFLPSEWMTLLANKKKKKGRLEDTFFLFLLGFSFKPSAYLHDHN